MANGHQPHIRWRRLNLEEPRGRRQNPPRPPGPPLRSRPADHGADLQAQTDTAVGEAQRRRQALGIDPSRLLLLEMRLLQNAEREFLERLGLQIIDEAEVRQAIEPPFYAFCIRFHDEMALNAFAQSPDLPALAVTATERQRASNGSIHPVLLQLRFADKSSAIAFRQRVDLPLRFRFAHGKGGPQRVASRSAFRLILQFPDQAAIDAFRREERAYAERNRRQGCPWPWGSAMSYSMPWTRFGPSSPTTGVGSDWTSRARP